MTLHTKALRRLFCCLLVTSSAHAVTFSDTGLQPGTTYTYCVTAVDAAGNESAPACLTATTLAAPPPPPPPPDTTPPIISNVQASAQRHSATITWTTDEPSDSAVQFGTNLTASSATMVTAHSITLTNLARNTTYSYVVLSKDAVGNQATSATYSFRTRR